jgi:C_GCAxxG_C_C family probable redox protein
MYIIDKSDLAKYDISNILINRISTAVQQKRSEEMEEKIIREQFRKGYDCSQVVVAHYAQTMGISEETANKVAACFGGGMLQADICGAFTGALMVIGLKYGHYDSEQLLAQKDVMMAKSAEFRKRFYEKRTTCNCKELLGYDVSTPEGFKEALETGRMMSFCPALVKEVLEILDEIV